MGARSSQDDRTLGRNGAGRAWHRQWPRLDRTAVLAVSLSLLTLLSVFAVPVTGASPGDTSSAASVDAGAPAPLANAGQAGDAGGAKSSGSSNGNGGGNGNGGSNGNAGGDSNDDTDEDSDDGNGNGNGQSNGNGNGQANGNGNGQSNGSGNGQANGNDDGNGQANGSWNGQANGNDDGNGQANGNGNGNGQANGDGGAPASNLPGPADVDIGSVDVHVGSNGGVGPSNAGGNGNGPPDQSNAGGNDGGPPDQSNAGGNTPAGPTDGSSGNGPAVSVSTGPPDELGRDRGNSASGSPTPSSVVSVSVTNARSGDRVELDVSPTSVEDDDVAFEGISVTVKRGGDFTMQVTNSRERLSGSPAFEPEQAAESLGRIRLDHSITNEEVEEVSYTFRVSKGHLRGTDTDPEDVALFRYADGEWSELPTDVVGETETHYLLESDSPGMSEFAVGAKRPDFDTFWANVDAGSVDAGQSVTVRGRVTNDGGADGVYDARLVVDGRIVAQRSITIAAGGTRQINFRTALDRPGAKRISINGVSAGEVSVQAQPTESSRDEADADAPLTVLIDRLLDLGYALDVTSPSTNAVG